MLEIEITARPRVHFHPKFPRVELYSVPLKRYTRTTALLNLRIRCIKQALQSDVLSISLEAYIGGLNDRQQG